MLKDLLKKALMEAGAIAVGFSRAGELPEDEAGRHARWIAASHHAGMDYLPRHAALKRNPRHVLEDAATVVSIAFSYAPALRRPSGLPAIAAYAYGDDYHDVLRRRLSPVVARMLSCIRATTGCRRASAATGVFASTPHRWPNGGGPCVEG